MKLLTALAGALLLTAAPAFADRHYNPHYGAPGLANATVLIIRHAEETAAGPGLSPAGEARARAYAHYFRPFVLGGERLRIDTLVAAADSRASHRSRLTLEPLSRATGIPIQQPFRDRHVRRLALWLGEGRPGRTILIAWHHGTIPELLTELGADPSAFIHDRHWSSRTYDKVIVLRFDRNGAIMPTSSRIIREPAQLE